MTLIDQLPSQWAAATPSAPAVAHLDTVLSYDQLEGQVAQTAGRLSSCGVVPGDRVAVLLDNGPQYLSSFFGILRAGAVVVGINPANTPRDIAYILNHCGAVAVVAQMKTLRALKTGLGEVPSVTHLLLTEPPPPGMDPGLPAGVRIRWPGQPAEQIKPMAVSPHRDGDALATIIYTSGTTGKPKGVMLTHRNLAANTGSIVDYLGLTAADSVLVVLPFYYSYGLSLLLTHMAVGGRLVIDNRFAYPNKVLETMEQEQVTGFAGVPSTFAILIHKSSISTFTLNSLRYMTQAGGPMAPAMADEIGRLLPDTDLFIMYGQTEASARLSYLPPERLKDKSGSIGIAIPGVKLRLLDQDGKPLSKKGEVGEIVAQGDNVMAGYWKDPGATRAALSHEGLRTGDLARMDDEGFLFIVSRKSDMIKSGAHRISPKAIEEILAELEGVFESAAVGYPDQILGEAVALFVVPGAEACLTENDILKHCRKNLPRYKVPHRVILTDHLPKTSSGKIRRPLLVEKLAGAGGM